MREDCLKKVKPTLISRCPIVDIYFPLPGNLEPPAKYWSLRFQANFHALSFLTSYSKYIEYCKVVKYLVFRNKSKIVEGWLG